MSEETGDSTVGDGQLDGTAPDDDMTDQTTSGDVSEDTGSGSKYYAACDSGPHPPWMGPNRDTYGEAQNDADRHNASCPDQGAIVITPA